MKKSSLSLNARQIPALAIAAFTLASAISSLAATDTWTGGTTDWNTAGNWNSGAGPVPGSGDLALFNGTGGGSTSLTLTSGPESLNSLTFDTSSAAAYTIGLTTDPVLTVSAGGTIQATSSVANVETINVPITTGGAYTFSSNSLTPADTLNFGGAITLGGALTLSGTNTGANTISGAIGGTSGVIKSGVGTWVLGGANGYSGTTTIGGGGTLQVTGTLHTSNSVTMNGGSLDFSNSGALTQTLGNISSSSGANTVENDETGPGTSTLTVGNLNPTIGSTINYVANSGVNGGTASIVSSGTMALNDAQFFNGTDYAIATAGGAIRAVNYGSDAGTGVIAAGTTLFTPSIGSFYRLDGNATSTGGANYGGGTVKFNGSFTFTVNGSTTIGGFLVSGGNSDIIAAGSSPGLRQNSSVVVFDVATTSDSLTSNVGIINFNGTAPSGLVKTGFGTMTMTASSTGAGNFFIDQGTLKTTTANALGFGGANGLNVAVGTTTVQAGATLDLAAPVSMTVNEPLVLNGGTLTNSGSGTTTIDNGIAGLKLTAVGTGGSATSGTVTVGGNTVGTASASGGAVSSLTLTAPGNFTTTPTVTVNVTGQTTSATATAVLSSVTLNGTTNTIGGTGNYIINAVVADGTSSGGFTKTGADTVTLTGANTYTGGTTVSAGTLGVSGSLNSAGSLAVGAGANFALGQAAGGASFVSQTVSTLSLTSTGGVGSGNEAVLKFNLGAGNDFLTSTGALTLNGSSFNLNLTGTPSGSYNLLEWAIAGSTALTTGNIDLTLNGSSLGLNSSDLSIVTVGGNDILEFSAAAVPEPSTWALLFCGTFALLLLARRGASTDRKAFSSR